MTDLDRRVDNAYYRSTGNVTSNEDRGAMTDLDRLDAEGNHECETCREYSHTPMDCEVVRSLVAENKALREVEEALAFVLNVPLVDVLDEARKVNKAHRSTFQHQLRLQGDAALHHKDGAS